MAAVPGALYGIALWLIFASFVMPIWVGAVTEMDPPVPDWNWLSFVAHVVYGGALGAFLPVLRPAGAAGRERAGDLTS